MDELLPVTHYGVHTTPDGVVYLHQGRKASNFISMKQPSPYKVTTRRGRICPHLINPASTVPDRAHWELFTKVFQDPMVQAMLPVPKQRGSLTPYINDPNGELTMDLVMLSRLGSPIFPVVVPFHKMSNTLILEELSLTNVLPLVLTHCQTADQSRIEDLMKDAPFQPRRLVLSGSEHLVIRQPMVRIQTNLWHMDRVELQSLNMETIGAALLRRYARGEQLDTDFVRE